jgi:DNA-binding NarL/FixJ family response regulator
MPVNPTVFAPSAEAPPASSGREKPILTARQVEILALVAEGLSSKEIADRLFISKRTVDFHLSETFDRLEVSNRVQALRAAWSRNLLPAASAVPLSTNQ